MTIEIFGHPFSSYTQKALIAVYENNLPFTFRELGPDHTATGEAFAKLWPIRKFPILVEGGRTILEATSVIEYLHIHHPGPVQLIPGDPDLAIEARMMDRVFDNYVMTPQGKCVFDAMRDDFTLADCAAAPSLFYADWTHPIPETHKNLQAYRARLLARPSFARCVDEARYFRAYFPLGAPDRD